MGRATTEADEEFDDLPETHLDEDAYEEFVAREFDSDGSPRAQGPPMTTWLVTLIALLLLIAVVLFL